MAARFDRIQNFKQLLTWLGTGLSMIGMVVALLFSKTLMTTATTVGLFFGLTTASGGIFLGSLLLVFAVGLVGAGLGYGLRLCLDWLNVQHRNSVEVTSIPTVTGNTEENSVEVVIQPDQHTPPPPHTSTFFPKNPSTHPSLSQAVNKNKEKKTNVPDKRDSIVLMKNKTDAVLIQSIYITALALAIQDNAENYKKLKSEVQELSTRLDTRPIPIAGYYISEILISLNTHQYLRNSKSQLCTNFLDFMIKLSTKNVQDVAYEMFSKTEDNLKILPALLRVNLIKKKDANKLSHFIEKVSRHYGVYTLIIHSVSPDRYTPWMDQILSNLLDRIFTKGPYQTSKSPTHVIYHWMISELVRNNQSNLCSNGTVLLLKTLLSAIDKISLSDQELLVSNEKNLMDEDRQQVLGCSREVQNRARIEAAKKISTNVTPSDQEIPTFRH